MGRPKKVITETKADIIDKLTKEIDPEIILAGVLGGIATAGGVIPPFTRMLMAMSNNDSTGSDWVEKIASGGLFYPEELRKFTIPGGIMWLADLASGKKSDGTEKTEEQKTKDQISAAIVASGMFEAMLMMSFAKNPSTMEALGKAIGGLGAIKLPI